MNYLALLGLVSAICGILSFFASQLFKSHQWLWAAVVAILTFASGFAIHYNSELERVKDIHRQASAICEHYHSSYSAEFIQESLVFLEENRDVYPDSYNRAVQSYDKMKNATIKYDFEVAGEMYGIVKGIATLNDE